jgi:hypothetical protein
MGYAGYPDYAGFGPTYGGFWGYGVVGGPGGFGGAHGGASESMTETRSLASGVGDEGRIKQAMAQILAKQATPEYAASLDRSYDQVALRASASPTLRVALRLPTTQDSLRERDRIRAASGEITTQARVTLTLKDGEKIRGNKMREDKDWIIVEGVSGGTVKVRQSEVIRIDQASTDKVAPAVDDR